MLEQLLIRLAEPADIHAIASVYAGSVRELCKDDYPAHIIAHWQVSTPAEARLAAITENSLWVAEIEGVIAGYLVAVPGELVALFIDPIYANKGIGKKLAQLGVQIAKAKHNPDERAISNWQVRLESTITAAAFYQKLGFEEVGRGYFSHGSADIKIPVINMILKG